MTTREAGERLGVSDSRVRHYINDKRLHTERAGRIHLIAEADVEQLAAELVEEAKVKRKGRKASVSKLAPPPPPDRDGAG